MTGHTLGAAGAIESVFTVLTVERGVLPPTINHEYPDPECDLDYVPNQARPAKIRLALNNSFGFGGANTPPAFWPAAQNKRTQKIGSKNCPTRRATPPTFTPHLNP